MKGEKYLKKIIETNNTEQENTQNNIMRPELSEDSRKAFRKAMKIAYFKEFCKQGLITNDELEKLIALQNADNIANRSA